MKYKAEEEDWQARVSEEQEQTKHAMITGDEIEECGWAKSNVLVPIGEEDKFLDGWIIDTAEENTTDPWWEMYKDEKNSLVIIKKWYRNLVGQEWEEVMNCKIVSKKDLLEQMDWLKIR